MARKIFYVYYSYGTGSLTSGVRIEGHGSLGTKTKIGATSVDVSSFDPTVRIVESGFGRGVFLGISAKGAMVKPLFKKDVFWNLTFGPA